jgi:precorrin-2 dehydrogenase/sirohydrochlorin ferrochelatase
MQRKSSLSSKGKSKGYHPLYLKLEGKKVFVIGGGRVAERKILPLLRRGAELTVISPNLSKRLKDFSKKGKIRHLPKLYEKGDLKGAFLVIAAVGKKEINRDIAQEAASSCCLYNVVDDPEASNFIVPSSINRGNLTIAISTSGVSPALSKRIRQELEKRYGKEYGLFLNLMEGIRKRLMKEIPLEPIRRRIFQRLVDSGLPEIVKKKGIRAARIKAEEIISRFTKPCI